MIHPLADQGEGKPASFVAREFSLDAVRGDETLAHLRARALPRLHQRQARRRRPADPGLDLLRQAHRLPDLSRSPSCCGRARTGSRSGWRTAGTARRSCGGTRPIFNCWGDKIGALAEIASGDDGAAADRRLLEERLAADPAVGHLLRRDLRRPAREPAGDRGRRGAGVRHRPPRCRRNAGRSASLRRSRSRESWTDRKGRTIYDFGQNAAGYVAFDGARRGGRAGDRRAFGDRRPRPGDRQPQLPLGRRRGSSTC